MPLDPLGRAPVEVGPVSNIGAKPGGSRLYLAGRCHVLALDASRLPAFFGSVSEEFCNCAIRLSFPELNPLPRI